MGFFSGILKPIAEIAMPILGGILGNKGANDRNDQQIAMTREQMEWQQNMSDTAHQREMLDLSRAGLNPILSGRGGASTAGGGQAPQLENALGAGVNSAMQAKLINAQVEQAQSASELNTASAMKARAEAWQTSNYGGPEAEARINSAQSGISLNSFREKEIQEAIEYIKQQVKTEYTKRDVNLSTADLNRALEVLRKVETTHSNLGLSRSRAESKFFKEGAIGENSPEIKMIMDIVKGVSALKK